MIVQEHVDHYRCITQHDHGRISGILAQAWRDPQTHETASDALIMATYLHDILWVPVDLLPHIDANTGRPMDFIAFPMPQKLDAYRAGIEAVGGCDPYMGLLHARHFATFVPREHYPDFRAAIDKDIGVFSSTLSPIQRAQSTTDLALLQLFDVFSLLLCMSGPHLTREPPPWLNPSPRLVQRGLTARWLDAHTFTISPYCFDRPLEATLPYRSVPRPRSAEELLHAWADAPIQFQRIAVTPDSNDG